MLRTGHFMRPPEDDQIYNIGDRVEVNCDHEDEEGQRIRAGCVVRWFRLRINSSLFNLKTKRFI